MRCSEIEYRKISELTLLSNNPRTITKKDMDRLVDSIRINGFWKHRPITLSQKSDGTLVVIAGNQRLKAAKKLKLEQVPVVIYYDLTALMPLGSSRS